MADEILPEIAEDDYEDFLRIIARYFPDACDEWPANHPEWLKIHREKSKGLRIMAYQCFQWVD